MSRPESNAASTVDLPLKGIVVADFSTLLPGPLAGLMLAEAGAEVIKIERPGGEDMRSEPEDFAILNRGKRSIEIDLKASGAKERLRPLLERADVVLEQFRPGVMERLGLGYAALCEINPRIIYCSINGYGSTGPAAMKVGHDLTYAAESGLLMQSSGGDGAPSMPQTLLADIGAGAYPAVINILLALLKRQQTGAGSCIEIAMYDHLFPFLYPAFASAFGRNHWPMPNDAMFSGASPRYNIYPTRDGRYLAAAAREEKFWRNLCEAIGLAERYTDDRQDPAATKAEMARLIAGRDAHEWEAAFAGREVACVVVKTFQEALADPHFASRRLLEREVTAPGLRMPALPLPVCAPFRDTTTTQPAPQLGEANEELLGPEVP